MFNLQRQDFSEPREKEVRSTHRDISEEPISDSCTTAHDQKNYTPLSQKERGVVYSKLLPTGSESGAH